MTTKFPPHRYWTWMTEWVPVKYWPPFPQRVTFMALTLSTLVICLLNGFCQGYLGRGGEGVAKVTPVTSRKKTKVRRNQPPKQRFVLTRYAETESHHGFPLAPPPPPPEENSKGEPVGSRDKPRHGLNAEPGWVRTNEMELKPKKRGRFTEPICPLGLREEGGDQPAPHLPYSWCD